MITRSLYPKIVQLLPSPEDRDPHPALLVDGRPVRAGEPFEALLGDGCWHQITLEIHWDVEGPGCWYILEDEFRDISPIGLFVRC